MSKLFKIWTQNNRDQELKLRYCDWNHRIKYVRIYGETADGTGLSGELESGERVVLAKNSDFWEIYHEGDEHQARAV